MTQEEKAKAYDEALERAKEYWETDNDNTLDIKAKGTMEYLFPELKESEGGKNKRISKEITQFLKQNNGWNREWLAWLEKQGEKPQSKSALEAAKEEKIDNANKVETKFKVGDWVIDKQGIVHQITNVIENVTNHTYGYDIVNGGYFNDNTEGVRLWTIQDAKDGDVLYSLDSNRPFIFKERNRYAQATAYCGLNIYGKFFVWDTKDCVITCSNYVPATKEQRDLLFAKMKEAGYEWDAGEKELKKVEQKPAWSEEDEWCLENAIMYCEWARDKAPDVPCYETSEKSISWLKSLKERVQPQNTWKPSDEQMIEEYGAAVKSLYQDLKKLRGKQ